MGVDRLACVARQSREDLALNEEDHDAFLEMIESESVRLSQIVDQILVAGQLDAGAVEITLEECDAEEIAAGVFESALLHLPPGVSLSMTADGQRRIVRDENKLRQPLV